MRSVLKPFSIGLESGFLRADNKNRRTVNRTYGSVWTVQLFLDELDNIIAQLGLKGKPIDVFGHSWGGCLAAVWAGTPSRSGHLRRLVISNSLASMDAWRTGITALRNKLPEDVQEVLRRAEPTKAYDTPEYEAAMEVFYQRHFSLARPWPAPEVTAALEWFAKDSTTYNTIELDISGSLRDWTLIPLLKNIQVPTLLINGAEDEAQDVAMQPFFDHIAKVKWVTLDNAAHFSHVDQREKTMTHLRAFLGN
ncbi:L-amino acid amidase [Lachnellula suecica]|uniref:L-amino acid amidase n=1 Tax=Lachnellula suecica TaxID=602035 RepID=A0A8T9BSX9_9HELO|nr:L-amino acid amidase [Lachnellula suecica]